MIHLKYFCKNVLAWPCLHFLRKTLPLDVPGSQPRLWEGPSLLLRAARSPEAGDGVGAGLVGPLRSVPTARSPLQRPRCAEFPAQGQAGRGRQASSCAAPRGRAGCPGPSTSRADFGAAGRGRGRGARQVALRRADLFGGVGRVSVYLGLSESGWWSVVVFCTESLCVGG